MIYPKEKPHAGGRGALENANTRERDGDANNTSVAQSAPHLALVENPATGELSGEKPALIPPGEYQLQMTHWVTGKLWGRSLKVALHFVVCDPGSYFGSKLIRYYNIERFIGRAGKCGRFKVRWNHDLVREYCTLIANVRRLDRIDLERFTRIIVVGRVETVSKTAKQKVIPPALQYSVVRELLRIEAGCG